MTILAMVLVFIGGFVLGARLIVSHNEKMARIHWIPKINELGEVYWAPNTDEKKEGSNEVLH